MKDLTIGTMLAVFEEIFGRGLFWLLVVIGVAITVAFLYILIRDRSVAASRLVRAQLWAPLGFIAAIWFVFWKTKSGLGDMGGAIDVILMLGVGVAGAVGLVMWAYTIQGFIAGWKKKRS